MTRTLAISSLPVIDTLLVCCPAFIPNVSLPILPPEMKREVSLLILFNLREDCLRSAKMSLVTSP